MVTEISKKEMDDGILNPDETMKVIMFYGSTCGPCKATMPNYEAAAEKFLQKTSRIKFYRVHAWDQEYKEYYSQTWHIEAVPEFKIMYAEKVVSGKKGGGDFDAMMKVIHDGIDETFKQYGEKI